MAISKENLARRRAKENYEKDILELARVTHSKITTILTSYSNQAFKLAVKHSEAIKEIKEEYMHDKQQKMV